MIPKELTKLFEPPIWNIHFTSLLNLLHTLFSFIPRFNPQSYGIQWLSQVGVNAKSKRSSHISYQLYDIGSAPSSSNDGDTSWCTFACCCDCDDSIVVVAVVVLLFGSVLVVSDGHSKLAKILLVVMVVIVAAVVVVVVVIVVVVIGVVVFGGISSYINALQL